nr:uncharacterized protein LOC106686832 [Halyomorpha halys]
MDFPGKCAISIPEYFSNQHILITGGAGLMGKVLIEKILRSCPSVSRIYVLMRPKKGLSIEERWCKIIQLPLFEKLKREQPDALNKVELVLGDTGEKTLGLSDHHKKLLMSHVTIIYHAAAMIQFTDSMTDALLQNTGGTYMLLDFAKRFRKLQVFVHVSTAYSNCNRSPDKSVEDILPPCQDWRVMLKMLENHPTQLEALKEKLLGGHPNPYTWSKSLAEQVVNDSGGDFQKIIMRPAIVCSTLNDPIPGWIDGANSFSAMSLGCAYEEKGKKKMAEVYNCASSRILRLTVGEIERYGTEIMDEYPSSNQVWVKSVRHTTNKTAFSILFLLHQILPALFADLVLLILRKQPIALRLTKKMVNAYRLCGNLVGNNIGFPNERYMALGKDLKDEDLASFSFALYPERKREILHSQVIGFRKYFLKEDMTEEAIKNNRKRMDRIKFAHGIITSLLYLTAAWCLNPNEILSIPEYFSGQSILVTGGTGLMGKVLVEKILRSCPEVDKIYLLIRPKKGVPIQERWSKLTDIPLFEKLKSKNPDALKKVHLILGDMTSENLGLSPEDRQLLMDKVTILYHIAAMIQFTDKMKDALIENVKGTYVILELAKTFINLKVFIYMSTAYSNFNKHPKECIEKIIPACQDWKVMLKVAEAQPLEFELLKEKLLDGHPNPYTWSKSLAEAVVDEYRNHFPTIIMRPGIVCSTMDDPFTGWIDAANGFSAFAVAAAYGVVRVLPVKKKYHCDFIPVDCAIKASLIAPWKQQVTWDHDSKSEKKTDVYNCVYMNTMPITNEEIMIWGLEMMEKYPSVNTMWVPSIIFTTNEALIRVLSLFLQVLPALAADLFLLAKGKQTRAVKITKKLVNAWRLTRKIRNVNIAFPNERFIGLPTYLKNEDKEAFSYKTEFDPKEKKNMICDQGMGFRNYFMKEDLSFEALERNRQRTNRIKLMHRFITSLLYLTATWCLVSTFKEPIMHLIIQ